MDNYLAEIRMFPYNNIPSRDGWVVCNGQTLAVNQYQALFSLIGNQFGGDGRTNFMLPNLNGRALIGSGVSPVSGTVYRTGNSGGQETVQLTQDQQPMHSHQFVIDSCYDGPLPATNFIGDPNTPEDPNQQRKNLFQSLFYNTSAPNVALNINSVTPTGGSVAHENRMPYLTMVFCIATKGIYPMHAD